MIMPIRVLFVCTGNSARSLLAEAVLRERGGPGFEVHSAGTAPRGVNPLTLRILEEATIPAVGLTSTPLETYLGEPFDYVVTVCDDARQVCPVFPGEARARHWSLVDPATVEGTEPERMAAFRETLSQIESRVAEFLVEVAAANLKGASG